LEDSSSGEDNLCGVLSKYTEYIEKSSKYDSVMEKYLEYQAASWDQQVEKWGLFLDELNKNCK